MGGRRRLLQLPGHLARSLVALLHGIPEARADILRAEAERKWLACLRGYLDIFDRLHIPIHQQREIIGQVVRVRLARRGVTQQVPNVGTVIKLGSGRKLSRTTTLAKQTTQVNVRPIKRKHA